MADKKTIMFYINCINKGGAERVFVQLADRFAREGYRSILVTSYIDRQKGEYEIPDGVERISIEDEQIVQSRLKRNYSRIKALRALCIEHRPAALVACMQEPNFRAVLATRGLGIKTVVSVCNAAEKEYGGFVGGVVGKLLMPMADGCVFQTEEEKAWFPRRLQAKGAIICNQVNETFFDTAFSGERKNIVTVGRLNPQKNQKMLIDAFAQIADRTDERLLLYGAGELKDALSEQISALGLEGRVRLMGLSANVAEDIKGARLFVLSSDYEGLPNALLEAMALGLPCISTDCAGGGPRMVIDSGRNGILTPVGDKDALAREMLRLLTDSESAQALGKAARASAESFRPEPIFARWQEYIENIIEG